MTKEEALSIWLPIISMGVENMPELKEAFDMAVESLKRKWIPVSEGLPEDGEWAIFTDGKHKSIERYKEDALDHFYPAGRWFELEDAVAWMPLPEDYKEDKED